MGNTFKTALLLTAMTLLLLFLGQTFGGERGMMLALVFFTNAASSHSSAEAH